MNWNSWKMFAVRAAMAIANLGMTGAAAVTADRLSATDADAGPLDWAKVVGILVAVTGTGATNLFLRKKAVASVAASAAGGDVAPHLAALGTEVSKLIAKGNLPGAGALLTAAKALKGGE